ncbi:UNVERIFIED_CONTAM: Ninja-family protein [Sesamum angustifolium]|uniref:Ninja-family protein n=1 Tax=Sesamum angustifolium TaxID=2727405 RepID=A0AAW2MS43_9LAMI
MPMHYGVSFPGQAVNMNMSYSQPVKDSNPSGTPCLPSYPLPSIMHTINAQNGDRPGIQPVMPTNIPLMFGYSAVQLPQLDRDNPQGIVSHHQQIHPAYSGRNSVNPDTHNDSRKLNQGLRSVKSTRGIDVQVAFVSACSAMSSRLVVGMRS